MIKQKTWEKERKMDCGKDYSKICFGGIKEKGAF